jgi:predicted oxidoreductase
LAGHSALYNEASLEIFMNSQTENAFAEQRLLLGCWRWHAMNAEQASALLHTAIETGIGCYDHADIYGDGDSERVFGAALKHSGMAREQVFIQSKCGIRNGYYDNSAAHILQAVDGILQRLDCDYLDALLLHRPDALMEPDEVASAFTHLLECGKVRQFGVSNFRPAQIEALQRALPMPLRFNQLQFGLAHTAMLDAGINANTRFEGSLDRDGNALEHARQHGLCIQAWSPLQFGFFEGNFLGHPDYAELNHALNNLAQVYSCQPGAIAIAWILRHPAKMQAILGTCKPARLHALAEATAISLSREQWYGLYRAAGNRLP